MNDECDDLDCLPEAVQENPTVFGQPVDMDAAWQAHRDANLAAEYADDRLIEYQQATARVLELTRALEQIAHQIEKPFTAEQMRAAVRRVIAEAVV